MIKVKVLAARRTTWWTPTLRRSKNNRGAS
jgi:hypothetical protein